MSNLRVLFVKRPVGEINPAETFKLDEAPIPALKDGEVLVKVLYISLDPAMRGQMNDVRSYVPPIGINEVMRSGGAGEVVDSKDPKFKRGDHVSGATGWQQFAVLHGKNLEKLDYPPSVSLIDIMSVLGGTGLTAFFGLLDVGKPKPGDTLVVSGAAGATGMIVAQIGKIIGCRVVGIAGGAEKVAFLKTELGLDEAVDYKAPDFRKQLQKACPNMINVYFDNVGGPVLDACLTRMAQNSTIVACGTISQYQADKPYALQYYQMIIAMRVTLRGFIVFDYAKRYGEARAQLSQWLLEGKLKNKDTIVKGLQNAPEAITKLFSGGNTGKLLVEVAAPAGSHKL